MLTRAECIIDDTSTCHSSNWSKRVRAVFPTLDVAFVEKPDAGAWCVDLTEWCDSSLSFWDFDQCADDAAERGVSTIALHARAPRTIDDGMGVLTRCQRWIGRRNQDTSSRTFDDVLRAHRSLYDLRKPLLLADYRHALDTWQWVLRLNAGASAPLQMAALLHDIERIASESDVRIEHMAANYDKFKAAHARRGAELTRRFLRDVGVSRTTSEHVAHLVRRHETPDEDEELSLLNDADALSFFSLNSAGYSDYYGVMHTARKIRYTLARMRESALTQLSTMRLRTDIARLTSQALTDAGPRATSESK